MKKVKRKVWIAIGAWSFLYLFMFNMMNFFQSWQISLMKSSYEQFSIMFMFYFTSLFLFPKFFNNNRNYLLISMGSVLLFSFIFLLIDYYFMPQFEHLDHARPPIGFIFIRILTTIGFSFFVSTSIKLMDQANKYQEKEKLLNKEKLQTELKLLKAQINPHFIFNALNNIYSLTFMKAANAPDSVLKLSEMLRYVFYDCSKDKVHLSAEIKYIENFIAFQQMKSDHEQKIILETNLGVSTVEVAPMLLIPFIENSFKYSRIEEYDEAYVRIKIEKREFKVFVEIENSIPVENKVSSGSGMGIKNVSHRLDIIYPDKHDLQLFEQDKDFRVLLNIEV